MPSASISRWTMSYFAAALVFLLAGNGLLAFGFGYPSVPVEAPETLIVVHVFTIGWLGLLFSGALLQFVPVLVARPLRGEAVALPALVAIISGLCGLIGGFLGMSGRLQVEPLVLAASACLLVVGFGALISILLLTLLSARPLALPARIVALGLVCLASTVLLGAGFASVLSGESSVSFLTNLLLAGVPFHAGLGIFGWMTLTAIGVSYRLLTMFMLAPEGDRPTSRAILGIAACALAVLALCLVVVGLGASLPAFLPGVAMLLTLSALALYGHDVLEIYRARRRKTVELNIRVSIAAICLLGLASVLFIALLAVGAPTASLAAAVYLILFGWLSALGLGQLYKIIPFLTWLECYGPVLGRKPVPRVQDLVNEHRAARWFLFYFVSVTLGAAALLLQSGPAFQASAVGQILAVAGLVFEFVQARRLTCADISVRLPEGARRPHLIFPSPATRS